MLAVEKKSLDDSGLFVAWSDTGSLQSKFSIVPIQIGDRGKSQDNDEY